MSTTPEIPPFGGLSPKRLQSLGKRLIKTRRAYDFGDKLEKAFKDWDVGLDGLWHLVQHGAVQCADNLAAAVVLRDDLKRESQMDRREAIAVALKTLPQDLPDEYVLMKGVPEPVYRLAAWLVAQDRDRAWAIYDDCGPNGQAAIALALFLANVSLPDGAAENLTAHMASLIGKAQGLRSGPSLEGDLHIDRIAAALGTTEQLTQAAIEHMESGGSWVTARGMAGALRSAPVDVVLTGLNVFMRNNGHISPMWEEVRQPLLERPDVADLAKALTEGRWAGIGGEQQRVLLYAAMPALPDGVENALTFHQLAREHYRAEYEAILGHLGQERAFALARRALDDDSLHPPSRRQWLSVLPEVFGESSGPLLDEAGVRGLV